MTTIYKEVKKVYLWSTQVRPKLPPYLCFTSNTAGSTVQLNKQGSPTAVTLETSTDGETRTTYTIGNTITLSNIWDKVYFRNTSETTTGFSTSTSAYYYFTLTWSINASWDVTSLVNKNCTTTLSWNYCFYELFFNGSANTVLKTPPKLPATTLTNRCYYLMFQNCAWLTTVPELPSTTLTTFCYHSMFRSCTNLEQLPKLPATTLATYCYNSMFYLCNKIKLSTTQTWEYQTEYRIPITWTWTTANYALASMFTSTWWTFTWTPDINTTYYTSNTLV